MKNKKRMNKKAQLSLFLIALLGIFAVGAYHVVHWIVHLWH